MACIQIFTSQYIICCRQDYTEVKGASADGDIQQLYREGFYQDSS